MITLEIAFNSDKPLANFPSEILGLEFDSGMKSDKSPSLWEGDVFSRLSGTIVHVFDRKFMGRPGYRALYDDIQDELDKVKFDNAYMLEFEALVNFCMENSSDGVVFVCSDCQFGPAPRKKEAEQLDDFLRDVRIHGLRINSCTKVIAQHSLSRI